MINHVVKTKCPFCHKYHLVEVDIKDFYAWHDGEKLVQDAFPYLSANEREMLISGICPTCWDKMFPPEEDPCEGDCENCPNPCFED